MGRESRFWNGQLTETKCGCPPLVYPPLEGRRKAFPGWSVRMPFSRSSMVVHIFQPVSSQLCEERTTFCPRVFSVNFDLLVAAIAVIFKHYVMSIVIYLLLHIKYMYLCNMAIIY